MEKYYYNFDLKIHEKTVKDLSNEFEGSKELLQFCKDNLTNENYFIEGKSLILGSGNGDMGKMLREYTGELYGIDISSQAVAYANENNWGEFTVADVCKFEFEDKFRLLVDNHCLHCLVEQNDRGAFFHRAYNALENGGLLLLESMIYHNAMKFFENYYYDSEQVLWKKSMGKNYIGIQDINGQIYYPIRKIRRFFEIEEEILSAGFKIEYLRAFSDRKFIPDDSRELPLPCDPDVLQVICRKV